MKAIYVLLILVGISFGQSKTSIAVLELDAGGISAYEAQVLSNRLRTELFKTQKFNVLERDKMDEILIEQGFQMSGCTTTECAVEVGKLTGVEQIVAGTVAKIDDLFTIDIRLIDVETGKVVKTATEDCDCELKDVLTRSIGNVAKSLAGIKVTESESNIKTYRQSTQPIQQEKPPIDSSHPDYRSPTAAFFGSFLLPGFALGQHISGETTKGLIMNGVAVLGVVTMATLGESSEWISDPVYTEGGYYDYKSELTTFGKIGLVMIFGSWIWSAIDAPISANRINYELGQQFGHLFEFNHNNRLVGLDIGVNKDGVGGQLTVHF